MLLSPREVAAETGLSYRCILRSIDEGELPATRLRGRLRISKYDLLAWLDDNTVQPHQRVRFVAPRTRTFQSGSLRALLDTEDSHVSGADCPPERARVAGKVERR